MEGGMGPVGPFANPVVAALVIFVVPAVIILAIYRGEQARRNRVEGLISARTRMAYLCFLAWGVFFVVGDAVIAFSSKKSFTEQQVLSTFVGIFLGVPATIVILVGLFHALMVWRVSFIRILLLATATLLPLAFSDFFRDPWTSMIIATYGLLVVFVSLRGLRSLRRSAAS